MGDAPLAADVHLFCAVHFYVYAFFGEQQFYDKLLDIFWENQMLANFPESLL